MNKSSDLPSRPWYSSSVLWQRKSAVIAALCIVGIITFLVLRYGFHAQPGTCQIPLLVTLVLGGLPMLYDLLRKLLKRQFGSDLLGGISIITSVLLGEYLAGSIIVLMLAGGEVMESYALRSARRCWRHWPSACLRWRIAKMERTCWIWRWRRLSWAMCSSFIHTKFAQPTAWWPAWNH